MDPDRNWNYGTLSAERRKISLVDSETQGTLARANPTTPWQRTVDEVQPFGNSRQTVPRGLTVTKPNG